MDCCVFNNIESNLLFYVKIWAFELYVDVSAKEIVRQLGNENDGILTLSRNNSKFYMMTLDLISVFLYVGSLQIACELQATCFHAIFL